MKFNEPFFGLAYADFDRNSACQVLGKGENSARLELPLKGCGTKQVFSPDCFSTLREIEHHIFGFSNQLFCIFS